MAPKLPEPRALATVRQVLDRPPRTGWKKDDSPALGKEGAILDLDIACRIGENPNSEKRFLRLLSAILPEHVNAQVPGRDYSIRWRIEHLACKSIHDPVRRAACRILETEIIVIQSGTSVAGTRKEGFAQAFPLRANFPGFSELPPRIKALDLLRSHVEGKRAGIPETELAQAIEVLKYDKDGEVASVLAHVASFSPHESIKEKARAVLCEF
ncbi:hypothetical protein L0Y65_01530 [Candidatus Micrarchaeota archaeon]|nr:hypothetical protein [Candidatus Micrarchaeota archaeon]